MIVQGTVYMTDSLELIHNELNSMENRRLGRKIMVLSLDEMNCELEHQYPNDVYKAVCLLPPPSAIFHQIDGDQQAFIDDYTMYLQLEVVTDYLSAVFNALMNGVNILLYTPSFGEDIVWINILLNFMENFYGIHIGTSSVNRFWYNPSYDIALANTMYAYNAIDVIQYMIITPDDYVMIPHHLVAKIAYDLRIYIPREDDPMEAFFQMRKTYHTSPTGNLKQTLLFGV